MHGNVFEKQISTGPVIVLDNVSYYSRRTEKSLLLFEERA